MGKSSTERQREYRQRHLKNIEGEHVQVNTVLSREAKRQLQRISRHEGISQRAVMEKLLRDEEGRILEGLHHDRFDEYYGVT